MGFRGFAGAIIFWLDLGPRIALGEVKFPSPNLTLDLDFDPLFKCTNCGRANKPRPHLQGKDSISKGGLHAYCRRAIFLSLSENV